LETREFTRCVVGRRVVDDHDLEGSDVALHLQRLDHPGE
jgi:hypothetical protein